MSASLCLGANIHGYPQNHSHQGVQLQLRPSFLNFYTQQSELHHGRILVFDTLISPTGTKISLGFHLSAKNKLSQLIDQHRGYLFNRRRASTRDNSLPDDEVEGSKEMDQAPRKKAHLSMDILTKLKRYGSYGILAYGVLNTAYYLTTFLLVWFYVVPSPGKIGYFAAVQRFVKVLAMVWAGSQVTKLGRAAGALALAPFMEKVLSWLSNKFKLESGKVYMTLIGLCIGMALILFMAVTLLWA